MQSRSFAIIATVGQPWKAETRRSCFDWGYRSGSPTAVQAWQPCPLCQPSPSHHIL